MSTDYTSNSACVNTDIDACLASSSVHDTVAVLRRDCAASSVSPFSICAITPQSTQTITPNNSLASSTHHANHLYQQSPRKTSSMPHWRSYTSSMESYEAAAKKEYQLLQRNFDITRLHPDFHAILIFRNPMLVKEFSKIRNKVFGELSKQGVKGYYVHEPSRKSWLHIHCMMICDGNENDLRRRIKQSFIKMGLGYGQDFHVKVKPVNPTLIDYQRLCKYILKFNGNRRYNRHIPTLFTPGLGIRKVGTIGKWFAKTKAVLWQGYIDEVRRKYGGVNQGITRPIPVACFDPSTTSD